VRQALLRHTLVQAGLWAAVVILANHASSAAFWRFDLTRDRVYTLAPATREAMAKLDRPVVARIVFTPGLGDPYANHATAVRDRLEELRAWSHGQLVVEELDPSDPAGAEEAGRLGLQPVTYRYRDRDSAEVKQVFMGVALISGDRQEVVDPITNLDTLEYELVRAIHVLTTKDDDRKTIGVLQGDGEPDLLGAPGDNPLGQLRDKLAGTYLLKNVVLGDQPGVPDDVDALLVIGPQQPLTDRALWGIDQYVMGGGSLALYLGQNRPDFDTMTTRPIHHRLDGWLAAQGVHLGTMAIVDRDKNEQMPLPVVAGRRRVLVQLNYPLIPVAQALNAASPITQGLNRVVAPFVTPITIDSPLPGGVDATWLVQTGATSHGIRELRSLQLEALRTPDPAETAGPFTVAVALDGRFTSVFAGKPIPAPSGATVAPEDPADRIDAGDEARIAVVSSADFVANNLPFVMNTIDWLVQDPTLMAIRSRAAVVDTLNAPVGSSLSVVKALMVGVPAAFLAVLAAMSLRKSA
jgi:ABC-2 type transport system permease protein